MKINEVIKKYRKEANLTLEQIANYLGVTAPAVNKWEKGKCLEALEKMVSGIDSVYDYTKSDLYSHIHFKKNPDNGFVNYSPPIETGACNSTTRSANDTKNLLPQT